MSDRILSLARRAVVPLSAMLLVALAACGGGGSGGGGGGATPQVIGLDSGVAPNNGVRCVDGPPLQDGVSQFPNLAFPFQGAGASCTLLTFSAQDPGIAQPGTVTTASIRIGATTGRMRFVRLRNLYQNERGSNGIRVCCSIQEYGAVFTPTPNSVTTVTLNFRMTFEPPPPAIDFTTVIGQDHIGLEVLDTNTPIPGVWSRNGLPDTGVNATFIWLPSISNQGFPAGALQPPNWSTSFSGFLPTFNYTFVPG
jgi:hypothetical protein